MANVDARITITADSRPAEREIERLAAQLGRIQRSSFIPIDELIRVGSIERSIQTINQLENAVVSLRSRVRSINSPGAGDIGDSIRTAATAANQFFDALASGERTLSNTISGLREQSNAFAALASNISSADARFADYIQGAQAAQDKGLRPLFNQFRALQRLYEEGITGRGTNIASQEIGATFFERLSREIPQTEGALKAFSAELQRVRSLIGSESTAALGVEQLIVDTERQLLQIEQDRLEVRAALNRELSAPVQGALSRMEGTRPNPFGISAGQTNEALNQRADQVQKEIDANIRQTERQMVELESLQKVLGDMETKKYDPLNISDAQINAGLDERASLYERQVAELKNLQSVLGRMEGKKFNPFGISDEQINSALSQRPEALLQYTRETEALQASLRKLESKNINWATALGINESDIAAQKASELSNEWIKLNAAAQALAAKAPETAAALNAFKFQALSESADAYSRALLNQQRTLDEYANSANRAVNAAKQLGYAGELPALRPAGYTNQDVGIQNLISDRKKATDIATEYEQKAEKLVRDLQIETIQRELSLELDSIETTLNAKIKADEVWWSKQKQFLDQKAKLEQEQAQKSKIPFLQSITGSSRVSNAISEGLIGGTFPLLFGQGAGSAILGGLGGFAGGLAGGGLGFGLSLIGTALGGLFDQLNQAAQEAGKSLNYPIEVFQKLKDANLLSSRAQEYYISKLIETGQISKATAELQAQMVKKIGVSGVNDLMALGDASEQLSKVWAEFTLQLQKAIAGPMTDLLKFVTSVIELSNKAGGEEARRRTTFIGLSDADKKAANERIGKEIKARGGAEMVGIQGIQDIRDRILKEYLSKSTTPKVNAPKEDFKTQEEVLKAQRQVADDIKSAYREGFQIQQRGIDLQRKVIDIRRRIEEDIFNRQQEILRQQIDNDRKRSQVAIEAVTLEYQKRAANEEGRAAEVLAAEADVIKTRMQGESEIAASKKLLQLDIDKQQRQTQKYIYDLSREADSIRRETLSLEMEAADYRLKIDRQIQDQRLIVAAAERSGAATVQATGGYTGTSVDGFPIGSRPGMRIHPLTGKLKDHKGVDIPMPVGTAIGYDVAGKVISTGPISGYGKTLEVELDNGVKAFSAHLSEVLVKVGDRFNANQLLAKSGATGGVTGPHLHQEGARGGDPYAALPNLQLGKAVTGVDAGAASAQAQLRRARSRVVDRPTVPALPVSEAAGTMQSLDASSNKTRQEAIKIEEKLLKLKDDQALQRLYEVARGPIELKQRKEAVDLARAELNYIIPTSQNTQERLLFEVQVTERIKNRLETDRKILANKNLEVDVRKKLTEAIKEGQSILSKQIKLDGEALMLAQQRKILEPAAQQTNQIYQEIEARKLRNRLTMEGFDPEIIDGELRVLQLQKDLKEQVTTYDVRLARLTGTIYDGTSATYESASAKLKELEATSKLTDKQKELKNELEEILKARRNIEDKAGSAIGSARQAAKASILGPQEKLGKKIGELRTEMKNLADPANQIISAADAIGSAFSESFKSIISGSSSAEEALGNFFQRTADNFLSMASQMIAKQIEMQVVGIGMNLLGGLFGGGSASTNLGSSSQNMAQYAPLPNAKGNAFADSIQPFAMGGAFTNSILSSPTLFQFANGGTMNTGVAGESGPEAIMPLTRGPGGSLGVKAYLADSRAALQSGSQSTDSAAFTDNRQAMEAASAAFADNRQAMEKTFATYKERFVESILSSTPATAEIKYTRVGSGDLPFVTEENMLQATRIAAQEGAKMGERRTLTALRNNPATRRTIGI